MNASILMPNAKAQFTVPSISQKVKNLEESLSFPLLLGNEQTNSVAEKLNLKLQELFPEAGEEFLQQLVKSAMEKIEIANNDGKMSLEEIVPWLLHELGLENTKPEESVHATFVPFLPMAETRTNVEPKEDKAVQELWTKIESLLKTIRTQADMKLAAPKLMNLLEQWQKLSSGYPENSQPIISRGDTKIQQMWDDLVRFYEKREQLAGKQLYQLESKVTNRDIVRILEKAIEKYGLKETAQTPAPSFQTGTSLGKLEQYVIYTQQTETAGGADKKFVEQFQQIIKSSKFLSQPNGLSQLSIRLRPENLGNMMIRLIQADGEMMVKITVTTEAAKDMLERNMNQLKHLFSPQQVTVEKQEIFTNQSQTAQKQHQEDMNDDFHQQSDNQKNDAHEQREEDEGTSFWEILNEKV